MELDRKGLSLWSAQSPDKSIFFKGKQTKGHLNAVPGWGPSKEACEEGRIFAKVKIKPRVRSRQW